MLDPTNGGGEGHPELQPWEWGYCRTQVPLLRPRGASRPRGSGCGDGHRHLHRVMVSLPSGILIPFLISQTEALASIYHAASSVNLPGPDGRFLTVAALPEP